MPCRLEPRRRHDIERARLPKVGLSLLAARPYSRVVILTDHVAKAAAGPPQKLIGRYGGKDGVGMVADNQLDSSIKII
jgi:hypothetical protein